MMILDKIDRTKSLKSHSSDTSPMTTVSRNNEVDVSKKTITSSDQNNLVRLQTTGTGQNTNITQSNNSARQSYDFTGNMTHTRDNTNTGILLKVNSIVEPNQTRVSHLNNSKLTVDPSDRLRLSLAGLYQRKGIA